MTRRHPVLAGVRRDMRQALALALIVTVFLDLAVLVVPLYDMQLYDRVLQSRNMDTLLLLSLACLAGLALYCLLDMLRSAAFATIAARTERRLHGPLLRHVVRQGAEGGGPGAAETMRDLAELRSFLSSGTVAVPMNVLCSPLLAAVLFMLHPGYGWLACAGAAALTGLSLLTDLLARPATLAAADLRTRASNTLAARLQDTELTEGLGMLPAIARRWAGQYGAALDASRQADHLAGLLAGVAKLIRLALAAGVIVLGAVLVLHHETTPGSIMGASLLLNKLMQPFDQLVGSWRQWVLARAAWQRTLRALATVQAGEDPSRAPAGAVDPGCRPGLVLAGVGYRDPTGRQVLRDVDAAVAPGEALCVSGPNGAGKSTLLRLLAGLAAPASGHILLDGRPLAATDPGAVGYLPQGVALLDGTVGENIARFSDAAARDIIAAAVQADVHEMIGRLRHGYDTALVSDAAALSGGQRQRIGLARALFRSPRLLILDEPDANLDHDGERALLQAIQQAKQAGAVVVVTTHRAALMQAMDHTLVLGASPAEAAPRPPARLLAVATEG